MNIAVLTAAGVGARMGQDIPKQFLHVDNKPVIVYTLEAFEKHPSIDAIIVVVLDGWQDILMAYAKQFNITKLKWVVLGGQSGQESIRNGLDALAKEVPLSSTVLIHDGNRCLVTSEIISDSLVVHKKYGSAVACIPCVEAVFESDDGLTSTVSIPRHRLLRTQTPHVYTLSDILDAHKEASIQNISNTAASCTLMQQLGHTVYFSKGSEINIKITTVEDLELFKSIKNVDKDDWIK